MRASSNASRTAAAVLAMALASSVGVTTLARAQSAETEPSSTMRSAAVEPSEAVKAATSPSASGDDLSSLPPTSDAPPQSDFKEPVKEEQPVTAAPSAPTQALDAQGEAILARLKDGKPLLARLTPKEREAMQVFYTVADYKPVWIDGGAFTPAAQSLITRLRAAAEDGLNPSAYPVPSLADGGRTMSPAEIADAELKLSAAIVLYARDARGGRVNLAAISKLITPDLNITPADLVLGQLAVSGTEAGDRLQAYNPNQEGYLALKQRLATLRGADPVSTASAPKPLRLPVGPVLKIGMSDPRVSLLREHFGLPARSEGTLDKAPGEADVYDKAVSDAVANFQRSHDLPDNGHLTRSTIVALALASAPASAPRSGDEAELISNMERWRWLPRELGSDYVLVNVPEYRLRVYRGGVMRDETRVIVGKTDSPTPIFSGAMETAVVNPSWFVPPSILKQMLASGRTAGFEVVNRHGQISLRQPPGEKNALGFIKFLFPNQHAVYLHDTPNRSLFSASKRAFSHGCVRVDDPFRFADAVLPDTWTEASLRKLIGKGERSIKLPHKLPVHIAYFTAFVDDAGVYRTLPDLYGYDAKIKEALGLSTRPGAMVSVPKEPARRMASVPSVPAAQANAHPKPSRPRREAMRAPIEQHAPVQRQRRAAPAVHGEPDLWTPAPPPSTPRFWW
ncbi:L,D-transpeptidase family protein [Methylobacterium sp. C25]|uniref:L,D-transpeptidase family protein n=1 Tax=Methylobacterium sp. C25 TaxID=2721622 RepID=UPI001F00E6F0|nr:L,D-transpeptidase family protein [Methylobacterium sp. C25]MCE4222858.1 L,D-transpeptidase family protein [Methylobacterium sp. C25]